MASRYFQVLLWAAIAFAFVVACLPQPPVLPGEPSDKIQHILAFATITALAIGAYPTARWHQIFLPLAALGGLIEIVQLIPSLNRSSDVMDWLADVAAVAVVLAIGLAVKALTRNMTQQA